MIPIKQSLGAYTAAEHGANFFRNVVSEHSANPRMLIVHEVMGRHCGWLTAYTAKVYQEGLGRRSFAQGFPFDQGRQGGMLSIFPKWALTFKWKAPVSRRSWIKMTA